MAPPPLGHSIGVGVQILGARKNLTEILGQGIDLVGADEAVEQDPPLLAPRRDFGFAGSA